MMTRPRSGSTNTITGKTNLQKLTGRGPLVLKYKYKYIISPYFVFVFVSCNMITRKSNLSIYQCFVLSIFICILYKRVTGKTNLQKLTRAFWYPSTITLIRVQKSSMTSWSFLLHSHCLTVLGDRRIRLLSSIGFFLYNAIQIQYTNTQLQYNSFSFFPYNEPD